MEVRGLTNHFMAFMAITLLFCMYLCHSSQQNTNMRKKRDVVCPTVVNSFVVCWFQMFESLFVCLIQRMCKRMSECICDK